MELIDSKIQREINKLKKYHQIDIKNIKAVCMKEVTNVVKKKAEDTARRMTAEHRKIASQFLDFKDRT